MSESRLKQDCLVLYKIRPARVLSVADKVEIELEGGKTKRVRPKDVELLHPGPLRSLTELKDVPGDLEEGWELLAGETCNLGDLAEIVFGDSTPSSAWSAWQLVQDGLYFEGTPESIAARDRQTVEADKSAREAKAAEERDWAEFVARIEQGAIEEPDRERLKEVEAVALEKAKYSRILQALGHPETPENAHRLLIETGYWPADFNPHPGRQNTLFAEIETAVPELPDEDRLDLTHLPAYAIDDEGNEDPDDAVSLDGDRLWIHVADVAALVPPDSELDLEARNRGSNLYLPERISNMLPQAVTDRLGLGLQEISPALSFGVTVGADGSLSDIDIRPSLVRVERLTYPYVDLRMDEEPFRSIADITGRFRAKRKDTGAVDLELPEANVRVVDGEVRIRPLPRLRSRDMVTDAMLIAGVAAAQFCVEHHIPIPYAAQPEPEGAPGLPATMAEMYAFRRYLKPSRLSLDPQPHYGLGLERYTRATSPLRRYSDLLVHQQLRAFISGRGTISESDMAQRNDRASEGAIAIRRTERFSNQHWKLVYLSANAKWTGEAVVVEAGGQKATVIIPQLAMEAKVRFKEEPKLDKMIELAVRQVDVIDQLAYFQVLNG